MKYTVVVALVILFVMPTAAQAQGPTPTPAPTPAERMYSRDSLLENLGAQPINPIPIPDGLNTGNKVIELAQRGGSGFWTMLTFYGYGPIQLIMLLLAIVIAATLIMGIIHRLQGKPTSLGQEFHDIRRRR